MSKDTFKEALRRWVIDVVERSQSCAAIVVQPREIWVWDQVSPAGGSSHNEWVPEASWQSDFYVAIVKTAAWDAVVEEIPTWPELNRHIADEMGSTFGSGSVYYDAEQILRPFVPEPVFDVPSNEARVSFDPADFDLSFLRFSEFIESDCVKHQYATLLFGLSLPTELLPLRLAEDVLIDRLSETQITGFRRLRMLQPSNGRGPIENPYKPWLALQWTRTGPKFANGKRTGPEWIAAVTSANEETEFVHEAVLAALILTKYGVVTLGSTIGCLSSWKAGGLQGTRRAMQPEPYEEIKRNMRLEADDLETVKRLFGLVRAREAREDALGIAIRRLIFAMENTRDEDRLLDGMMAAESLMGEQTEIAFKIALRTAFFLAENPAHRRSIFDDIKNAYDVRSKLVHGYKPDPKKMKIANEKVSLAEFTSHVEGHIRAVMRGIIENGGSIPDWTDFVIGQKEVVLHPQP